MLIRYLQNDLQLHNPLASYSDNILQEHELLDNSLAPGTGYSKAGSRLGDRAKGKSLRIN